MKTKLIGTLTLFVVVSMLAVPVLAQKTQTPALTNDEIYWLTYIREEEKVARDAYLTLYDHWGIQIFQNIAASEQTHMDKVKTLLDRYGVPDPVADMDIGKFGALQDLYDALVLRGQDSLVEALNVGVAIELKDIDDLNEGIDTATRKDITTVYSNLLQGSLNHLAAFESQLTKAPE